MSDRITNQSLNLSNELRQKYVVMGPSGVGKTTLVNMLKSQSVTRAALRSPGRVSDGMAGCTSECELFSNDDYDLIDTIGWDDNRFSEQQKLDALVNLVRLCDGGINGVFFVVKRGEKLPSSTRNMIRVVCEAMFSGNSLTGRCTVVVTNDCDGGGKEWFQRQAQSDETAQLMYALADGKVVSGTLESSSTNSGLESVLESRRERLLGELLPQLSRPEHRERRPLSFDLADKEQVEDFVARLAVILQFAVRVGATIVVAIGALRS